MEPAAAATQHIGIDGAPDNCSKCGARLCLRKQVINLALGIEELMLCLECLGKENNKPPEQVLGGIKSYILGRECFAKQWRRYPGKEYCPDPQTCFPGTCFEI